MILVKSHMVCTKTVCFKEATSDLEIEGQGDKIIAFVSYMLVYHPNPLGSIISEL